MLIKRKTGFTCGAGLCVVIMLIACGCKQHSAKNNTINKQDSLSQSSLLVPQDLPADPSRKDTATPAVVEHIRQNLVKIFERDLLYMPLKDRQFTYELVDLNGDHKKEIFVGFNSAYFCGSGGCTALLLSSKGALITRFTVAEYPIILLNTTTKGWPDLLIGTAAAKPSIRLIKWNGKKYPGNPSTQPEFVSLVNEHSKRVFNFKVYDEKWFDF